LKVFVCIKRKLNHKTVNVAIKGKCKTKDFWRVASMLLRRRKSLSGNWKTNIGQSILEEIQITDKHKTCIDGLNKK
jgi:hypothetical protein